MWQWHRSLWTQNNPIEYRDFICLPIIFWRQSIHVKRFWMRQRTRWKRSQNRFSNLDIDVARSRPWLVKHSLRHIVVLRRRIWLLWLLFLACQYPFPCRRWHPERNGARKRRKEAKNAHTTESHCSSQLMLLSDWINGCGFKLIYKKKKIERCTVEKNRSLKHMCLVVCA